MKKTPGLQSGFLLTLLFIICLFFGWLVLQKTTGPFNLRQFILLLVYIYLVNLMVLGLFFKTRFHANKKKTVIFTYLAIVLKFIFYLLFILVFYLITKNLSKEFIISFFILYLAFTFFTLWRLLKALKIKD